MEKTEHKILAEEKKQTTIEKLLGNVYALSFIALTAIILTVAFGAYLKLSSSRVYTIDTGGEPPPGAVGDAVAQRLEGREALKRVAEMTGGRSFAATSGTDLLAAYREISTLEKSEEDAPIYRRYYEYYAWCAGLALVLLSAVHALDRTLWRVVT